MQWCASLIENTEFTIDNLEEFYSFKTLGVSKNQCTSQNLCPLSHYIMQTSEYFRHDGKLFTRIFMPVPLKLNVPYMYNQKTPH